MLVLGIETSCDETAFALVENGAAVRSAKMASSAHLHERFGGVVPEIASRMHVEVMQYLMEDVLSEGAAGFSDIDLIAVTRGPGLPGSLLTGISIAKALALSTGKPLVGVNHVHAHLWGALNDGMKFPCIGFVISGGHTALILFRGLTDIELLGQTTDDAVGEAFDKVAKILKLGYPGGPIIDRLARGGDPEYVSFPRAKMGDTLNFSFSGLKTAVLYYVRDTIDEIVAAGPSAKEAWMRDVCASFQEACVEVLLDKLEQAVGRASCDRIVFGGGVSANTRLRQALAERNALTSCDVVFPETWLCTDNAVMVARYAHHLFQQGVRCGLDMTTEPNLGIQSFC